MTFTLEEVYPWGRSFGEYQKMFSLGESELRQKIVGCADGPASFNVQATQAGSRIVSCDPLYALSAGEIRARIEETYDRILEQARQNESEFLWDEIKSVEDLGRTRWDSMATFLIDFASQRAAGRYVAASLPALPFADRAFDIALCSHYLFLYSGHLTQEFHVQAIVEMCRVAPEARVFPLLSSDGGTSNYVDSVCAELETRGLSVSIERVSYEFQRGGNEMLRVRR
jgi:hypothetical protein